MTFQSARAISLPVASATVIAQRRFVTIDANGQLVLATASGDAIGVTLEASANGDTDPLPVAVLDGAVLEIEAGAAITRGAKIAAVGAGTSAGRADDTAANALVTHLGIALDAAANAGDIIRFVARAGGVSA